MTSIPASAAELREAAAFYRRTADRAAALGNFNREATNRTKAANLERRAAALEEQEAQRLRGQADHHAAQPPGPKGGKPRSRTKSAGMVRADVPTLLYLDQLAEVLGLLYDNRPSPKEAIGWLVQEFGAKAMAKARIVRAREQAREDSTEGS